MYLYPVVINNSNPRDQIVAAHRQHILRIRFTGR